MTLSERSNGMWHLQQLVEVCELSATIGWVSAHMLLTGFNVQPFLLFPLRFKISTFRIQRSTVSWIRMGNLSNTSILSNPQCMCMYSCSNVLVFKDNVTQLCNYSLQGISFFICYLPLLSYAAPVEFPEASLSSLTWDWGKPISIITIFNGQSLTFVYRNLLGTIYNI